MHPFLSLCILICESKYVNVSHKYSDNILQVPYMYLLRDIKSLSFPYQSAKVNAVD